jgi:hypothetical protein
MMAEPYVKAESPPGSFPLSPSPVPKRESESPVVIDDPPEANNNTTFVRSMWKRDDVPDRAKAVQVKEQAVKNTHIALYKFIATMNRNLATNPSAHGRIDKIRKSTLVLQHFSPCLGKSST